jgi:hypothetical protein
VEVALLSKSAKSKKPTTQTGIAGTVANLLKQPKFAFIIVCFVIMIYASVGVSQSSLKITIMLADPIVIILAIMGAEKYVWKWILNASFPRQLISAVSFVVIGSTMVLLNNGNVILGALLVVLASLLLIFSLWRFAVTRDLRVKGQDWITTLALVLFMASILVTVVGFASIGVLLAMSSVVVFFYRSSIFDIIVVAIFAVLLFTNLAEPAFGIFVVALGVVAEILGLIVRRRIAIKRRLATGREEDRTP